MKKNTHGGPRPGAGAKKKEPTTVICIRVPVHLAAKIKAAINETASAIINTSGTPSTKY